jgi:hypothetical protein
MFFFDSRYWELNPRLHERDVYTLPYTYEVLVINYLI